MHWASRGTPLDVVELSKMPRDKVGDVLIALRHAIFFFKAPLK